MKLNYDQMLENGGISYYYDPNINTSYMDNIYVREEFNIYLNNTGYRYPKEATVEQAITKLKEHINESSEKEIQRLESMKQQFRNLSFFKKLGWQINNSKLNFDATSEERKELVRKQTKANLENIQIFKIDKTREYIIKAPKLIKEGETLYVVVTDQNSLEMGVYEATANQVSYYQHGNMIELDARLLVKENGKDYEFNFSSDENEFKSNYLHHYIFTDKEKAIEFHNQSINEKLKNMQEKIINLNKPKMK